MIFPKRITSRFSWHTFHKHLICTDFEYDISAEHWLFHRQHVCIHILVFEWITTKIARTTEVLPRVLTVTLHEIWCFELMLKLLTKNKGFLYCKIAIKLFIWLICKEKLIVETCSKWLKLIENIYVWFCLHAAKWRKQLSIPFKQGRVEMEIRVGYHNGKHHTITT